MCWIIAAGVRSIWPQRCTLGTTRVDLKGPLEEVLISQGRSLWRGSSPHECATVAGIIRRVQRNKRAKLKESEPAVPD